MVHTIVINNYYYKQFIYIYIYIYHIVVIDRFFIIIMLHGYKLLLSRVIIKIMFVVMTSDYLYPSSLLSWLLHHKILILVNNYVFHDY